MDSVGPRTAILLLAVVALAAVAPSVQAVAERTVGATDSGGAADAAANAPTAPEANNSTVRHRDPDAVNEDGELSDLQGWLAGRLRGRLVNSTVRLERGEYERARSVLGDGFGGALSRYVEVADETPGDGDDRLARRFEATRERQREYVGAVGDYRETRRRYRQAKRTGDERRARRLARNLSRLQRQINRTGRNLTGEYADIGNRTGADFGSAVRAVENTTRNVSAAQTEIERETFVRTAVTVAVRSAGSESASEARSVSFRDPVVAAGRLTTANGTALADRRIAVRLGPQTAWTRTDADGRFETAVRPTLVGLGNRTVVAAYVPRNASAYLGANDSASVNVTRATPAVNLTRASETARFGETVRVAGRVSAGGAGARNVPVRVGVGRTVLGTARTDGNGTFAFEAALPASVAAGDRRVRATVALSGRALASASANASVAVAPTATRLTVERTETTGNRTNSAGSAADGVRLTGTLRTATGRPVPDGTVLLRVGGRTVATATANATGEYAVTVEESALAEGADGAASADNPERAAGNVTVAVVYEGSGNLRASRAVATVRLGTAGGSGGLPFGSPTAVGVAVGLAVVGLGALGLRRVGTFGALAALGGAVGATGDEAGSGAESDGASDSAPGVDRDGGHREADAGRALLARAGDGLAAGETDAAVRSAYAAVRREATALLDAEAETRTHWEFYRLCRDSDALAPEQVAAVEDLTEAFERARFATGGLPRAVAEEAVETAREFRASAGGE